MLPSYKEPKHDRMDDKDEDKKKSSVAKTLNTGYRYFVYLHPSWVRDAQISLQHFGGTAWCSYNKMFRQQLLAHPAMK